MRNLFVHQVLDDSTETYGGANPFPPNAGAEGGAENPANRQTVHLQHGGVVEEIDHAGIDACSRCCQRTRVAAAAVLICCIYLYPPMVVVVAGIECPEETFLVAAFGFVTAVEVIAVSLGVWYFELDGILIAVFPMLALSVASVVVFFNGVGDGCMFLGIVDGFYIYYPILMVALTALMCISCKPLDAIFILEGD